MKLFFGGIVSCAILTGGVLLINPQLLQSFSGKVVNLGNHDSSVVIEPKEVSLVEMKGKFDFANPYKALQIKTNKGVYLLHTPNNDEAAKVANYSLQHKKPLTLFRKKGSFVGLEVK